MRGWVRGCRGEAALVLGLALLCGARVYAHAAPIPHGTLELIAENQAIAAGRPLNLGLRFQLEKGWHIYWVNPGDSGEPPRVEWRLPQGITAGGIEWPTPERFQSSTVVDYGYENAVLLMVPLTVDAHAVQQTSAQLGAAVKLLVCSHEMCVPGKADLSLTLPIQSGSPQPNTENKNLFAAARKSLPQRTPANWKFSANQTSDSFELTARLGASAAGSTISRAVFFPLIESQIENAAQQNLASLKDGFRLTLRKSDQLLKAPGRLKGVLVVSAGSSQADQAFSIDVPIAAAAPADKRHGGTKTGSTAGILQNHNPNQYNP
jgi:DsbC/DsbD-like thiol-disulfide interchange protein